MDKANLEVLIKTMKGIAPANYDSMARLVSCVEYLSAILEKLESTEEESKEEVGNG